MLVLIRSTYMDVYISSIPYIDLVINQENYICIVYQY